MKLIIGKNLLKRAAHEVLNMIHRNTEAGIDADGRPFAKYSTTPFSMPAGAFFSQTTQRQRAKLNAEGDINFYRSKSGKRFVVVEGGYLNWKKAKNPKFTGKVDLVDTGQMFASMKVLQVNDDSAVIGFSNKEAAQKAYWHNVAGAGKRKMIRKFLGITKAQEQQLAEFIKDGVTVDMRDLIGDVKKRVRL